MSRLARITALIGLLTVFAAAAGGWFGVRAGLQQAQGRAGLDTVIHRDLRLSAVQNQRLERLEADFARRRRGLEAEMRAANADLATAIATEHTYGPRAQRAIERFHRAMGVLQEDTIRHVLAMRALMTPEQALRFDALVDRALKPPVA